MKRIIHSVLLGCIAGFVLNIVDTVCFNLLYTSISAEEFEIVYVGALVAGAGIALGTLIMGNPSILQAIFRGVLMLVSFSLLLFTNGFLGTIRYLQELLGINTPGVTDSASGMLTLTLLFTIFFTCVVVILLWCCVKGAGDKSK